MTKTYISTYLSKLKGALDQVDQDSLLEAWSVLQATSKRGGTVWICGNGGSASLAEHLAQDLSKQCGIKALSLTNLAMITALGNDVSYERIFSRQVRMYAKPGDLLVVISGSGNSPNILHALVESREMWIESLALLGFNGGAVLREGLADHSILVPEMHMGRSEDGHLIVSHILIYGLMEDK